MKTTSKTIDSAGQVADDSHQLDPLARVTTMTTTIITMMTTIMGPGPLNT